MRRVLAIDPGTAQSGFVVLEESGGVMQLIEHGVLDNTLLLGRITLNEFGVAALCLEMIASYGMPVGREVFETCVWIGRFQQAWRWSTDVKRIVRKDVKMHLCGSARAKDTNIWQALVDRFGPPGTKAKPGFLYGVKSHARAALALAIVYLDMEVAG